MVEGKIGKEKRRTRVQKRERDLSFRKKGQGKRGGNGSRSCHRQLGGVLCDEGVS